MKSEDHIEKFIHSIRRRLNRFRLLDMLWWSLAIGGLALLAVCLTYVFRGYAVPRYWYGIATGAILATTLVVWAIRRWSSGSAAGFADRFFELKDAVTSYRHFKNEGLEGDFYDLQEVATAERVSTLRPETVKYRRPSRLLAIMAIVLVACFGLGFVAPSPEIIEKLAQEAETTKKTDEINEHLEELIDELEEASNEEEKELLKPDELRKWVEDLKETEDRKEAMRQYAELERKLQENAQKLDQRKNEQLLAKAGEELQKDQETKELGKKMAEKKFREASKEMEEMKPQDMDEKKLSEQRKELAKLKAAAQRMASAAKAAGRKGSTNQKAGAQKPGSQSKSGGSASKGGSGEASGQSGGNSGAGSGGEDLGELMANLDESVKKLENALKNAELEKLQQGEISDQQMGQCNSSQMAMLSDFDKLSKGMGRVGLRRDLRQKLLSMSKSLSQCQGYLQDPKFMSLSQCLGTSPGGKNAGSGAVESRREGGDELTDNGNTSQLKGQKGAGPSLTTVEAANDGDGVSSRRSVSKQREYSRQLESFVQREDVPEDVKEGVKEYFKSIHQTEQ